MASLAQHLAPAGAEYLPFESSPLRAALYTLIGRLTVRDWAETYGALDWERATEELSDLDVSYPDYYLCDRHGVHGGFLTGWHALGWSFAAQFFGLPAIYERLAQQIAPSIPAEGRILDIGAGTGDWLFDLHHIKPSARLVAADLSPMMLAALRHRWQTSVLPADSLDCVHAPGERLPVGDASCDLVTALLLLHELPPEAARAVFAEARRVLKPGGRFITLDAIQHPISNVWMNDLGVRTVAAIFREPDFHRYTQLDIPALARSTGFQSVQVGYLGRLPWKFQYQIAGLDA
jgi:SAM-dependent methyltransferase